MRASLIYILKAPQKGLVKTRLASAIGQDKACAAYKKLVEHTLHATRGPWETIVCYTPADAAPQIKTWLPAVDSYYPQGPGDLGKRMTQIWEKIDQQGGSPIGLLGGDCPYIHAPLIEKAFALLQHTDCVVGPARDGGFYGFFCKGFYPNLFNDIDWGTAAVLQQTLRNLEQNQLSTHLLPELEDVDDLNSWQRAHAVFFDGAPGLD